MTDEELIALHKDMMLGVEAGYQYSPKVAQMMHDRIEALSISNATLIAERDALFRRATLAEEWRDHDKIRADEAEAKLAKAVEALGKLCSLAPVEKPPEPYDEYGWQIADTAERHAQMVLDGNLWAAADFSRTTLEDIKSHSDEFATQKGESQ